MSDPRVRRIDARPATSEVAEYRDLVGSAATPLPDDPIRVGQELVQLCRFRNRPALLRNNLRFGRGLQAIRVSDLDGDGHNEILVLDSDRTIHTLRYQPDKDPQPSWIVGAHRYRGRMLGMSFTGFGVFRRQEAIVTSVEEHADGEVYHELKLTCDGAQWDVSELIHRRPQGISPPLGNIRLIGDSCEVGRVPVLRSHNGRLWVEILDDRQLRGDSDTQHVALLPEDVSALVLAEDELVVAYARGGLQCIRNGHLQAVLFPQWRFSCLAYAAPRMLGFGEGPGGGLLVGGTTSGYVFAIDTQKGGVVWRMDAGFLFSCVALADVESRRRIDLLLGGVDGGLRIYELTHSPLVERRCHEHYSRLGRNAETAAAAEAVLNKVAPPGHDGYPAVQLYLLSRILDSTGPAPEAVLELVRWFTPGRAGWHMLPERAQREAVVMLERFLVLHLPQVVGGHGHTDRPLQRSTSTGPLPILVLGPGGLAPTPGMGVDRPADPQTKAMLTTAILGELADIYLAAPRLVRRQIDRISRRLVDEYWIGPGSRRAAAERSGRSSGKSEQPGDEQTLWPQLQRLLSVRALRAREYAHALGDEARTTLHRQGLLPEELRPLPGEQSDVLQRVLRGVGLLEEARRDRFSMEFERLDLLHAALESPESERGNDAESGTLPHRAEPGGSGSKEGPLSPHRPQPSSRWIAGIGRNGALRVEPFSAVSGPPSAVRLGAPRPVQEVPVSARGEVRFLEVRRLVSTDSEDAVILIGLEDQRGTLLQLYSLPRGPGEAPALMSEALLAATGVEPLGFDRFGDEIAALADASSSATPSGSQGILAEVEQDLTGPMQTGPHRAPDDGDGGAQPGPAKQDVRDDEPEAAGVREVLILRVPSAGREPARLLAVDAPAGRLRVREHLVPADLLCATANAHASLQVSASRLLWRPAPGTLRSSGTPSGATPTMIRDSEGGTRRALTAPTPLPVDGCCAALSDDGRMLALGTSSGLLQIFAVVRESFVGEALRLLAQQLLPKGISVLCFIPAAVFGPPAVAVGTEDESVHIFAVDNRHMGLELARLAVGGTPLRMVCLQVPRGHRLALTLQNGVVAAWDAPADAEARNDLGPLLELGARGAGSRAAALATALRSPGPHARAVALREILGDTRQAHGAAAVLRLCKGLLAPVHEVSQDELGWPLPRPERNPLVLGELCTALMPMALGPPGGVPQSHDVRLARELLHRLIQICEDPLAIRAELLRVLESQVEPEHVTDLLEWLPDVVLHDSRSATWPFSIDSVGALYLHHLRRMDQAQLFDHAEHQFFRHVATVLEAVAPSQPSRFLLTEVALLLRSALPWERSCWAGDLGRARLHLPHAVIEAMSQPAIIPAPEARAFLLGVSRRWGPRLPMIAHEEGDSEDLHAGLGVAAGDEFEIDWWLDFAVDSGFDELYYERLADELTRLARPAAANEEVPDAWHLADIVQAVLRLFDVGNLTELLASLQSDSAARSLLAIQVHRGGTEQPFRYRDQAWDFLDESAYETGRQQLLTALEHLDRKGSKSRLARSLETIAAQLDERRGKLREQIQARLSLAAPRSPLGERQAPLGGYAGRLLSVRPAATVVALMTAWWQVLVDEAARLRTEADFEVKPATDLGLSEGRRTLRHAVVLAPDTTRPAHGVVLTVRTCEPPEVHARPAETKPTDLEHGRELSLLVDCPAQMAGDGPRYRIELELQHDDGKRTERVVEGQFPRDPRHVARSLFDSLEEALPTLFQQRCKQLHDLLLPPQAAVALVTAFPAHAYELLGEVVQLEWPDRPVDIFEGWRMVNLAAHKQAPSPYSGGGQSSSAQTQSSSGGLRDVVQQIGARLGAALGIEGAERMDTPEALLRAVAEAPAAQGAGASKGLLILGLPDLCERSRLEEEDQRQVFHLGVRLCLSYRGRSLVLLSPQGAALWLGSTTTPVGGDAAPSPRSDPRPDPRPDPRSDGKPETRPEPRADKGNGKTLELLELDHVADPLSVGKTDERARAELELALGQMLAPREGPGGPAPSAGLNLVAAVKTLIDVSGADLRLIAECLPLVDQALRERARSPVGGSAFEVRVGNYMGAVWRGLPLPHRLYLAALACDAVELDLSDLRPGMVVDAPVFSISGKDRQPTSKVVVGAGVRLDEKTVEDLDKVMWLKRVRVRGSTHDSRTVLWTYLRQSRPRPRHDGQNFGREGRNGERGGSTERWLEVAAVDLRRLGLIRQLRLGERVFSAFTSATVREWLRNLLGLTEGETGLPGSIDGRNLVRQLPLWDAAGVDRALGGNSAQLRAVLGWSRASQAPTAARWQEFLDLSRACRKWIDGQDESRFIESIAKYFRLDLVEGTARGGEEESPGHGHGHGMRSVQIRFRDHRRLPWLKRVVMYLPSQQPDRALLEAQVQGDLRTRMSFSAAAGSTPGSGPAIAQRPDAGFAGVSEVLLSDTSLSAIVVVPELSAEVAGWSRNLFHVAAIEVADLQHAALHDSPVEELIRRLAAAASYAALSPFRSKMGLANQELIEEMFYGRRMLLEEIGGQRQENFIIVGPRKIGKTSLLQRVRLDLEKLGYRVIPRGMDYTTAPTTRELMRNMISDLMEDLEPGRGPHGSQAPLHVQAGGNRPVFGLDEQLPSLRQVVDLWFQRHPDRNIAIVLDEIDNILRTERRAYLLGEWREAGALGEALGSLLPGGGPASGEQAQGVRAALRSAGFSLDVVEAVAEGLITEPQHRRQSPLLEELRSASALVLPGGAVCRVILAGHAELSEARSDLFGPLLNFAKQRFLGPLDDAAAERMVREPFARLGLRFENAAAEQLLLQQTFRVPAWLQDCGARIIRSIDERLRSSRREEQKITERDVRLALDQVYLEERGALQTESGLYMLGPECSFVLLTLVDEPWFTIDGAVEFLRVWFELLEPQQRAEIAARERDFIEAFSPEVVRRIIRDLTNTFYVTSDEAAQSQGMMPSSGMTPVVGQRGSSADTRDRLRRTYRVNASMARAVFRDEINLSKRIDLARRGMQLWAQQRGVWARTASKSLFFL